MDEAPDVADAHADDGETLPAPVIHSKCGARARGSAFAHCGVCHATFTGVTAFDRHRRDGDCLNPTKLGMVLRDRSGWTRWGNPIDAELDTDAT